MSQFSFRGSPNLQVHLRNEFGKGKLKEMRFSGDTVTEAVESSNATFFLEERMRHTLS
ncbi:hypothetical protein WN51_09377 [Melipona quadrifasciata]|uniref:Uncharacterized protein n=1 Tax=Melipona quadrifasciata TaxID=166423 RepID=A0A0N0BII6_9HYME|nr:hypothetical protein WN51_09377 [Melipona quadrifasciata]